FLLTMLAERFAVIAQYCDRRTVVELSAFQPCNQASEFMVGVGNFSVIEMVAILRAIGLRRIIGAVRVVEMEPKEERTMRGFGEPSDGMADAVGGTAIHQPDVLGQKSL